MLATSVYSTKLPKNRTQEADLSKKQKCSIVRLVKEAKNVNYRPDDHRYSSASITISPRSRPYKDVR